MRAIATREPPASSPPVRLDSRVRVASWDGIELRVAHEDLRLPSDWTIACDGHTIVVHLAGPILRIDTEVDGAGAKVDALGDDEISVIPAGYRYAARARGGTISFATLRISDRSFREIAGGTGRAGELRLRLCQRDPFANAAMKRLAALAGRQDDVSRLTVRALIQALCGHLLLAEQGVHGVGGDREYPALSPLASRRVTQYVQEHLADSIDVGALARTVNVDEREFFRLFRNAFQTSPAQYVVDQRVRRAKWLLTHTRRDITEVALMTGFSSHSHLTTTFKKRTGVTPRAFRLAAQ